jgi:toxin ParE1/3/4
MARRVRILWSPEAEKDLEDIRRYIARHSPRAARSFTGRIVAAVNKLRDFPESGGVVEELHDAAVREIFVGMYRIIYEVNRPIIRVLAVHHGARLLGEDDPTSE